MEKLVGNEYSAIKCVSFIDPETSRKRVKSQGNEAIPDGIFIECSKYEREKHRAGTQFTTKSVKICKKPTGRIYGRAKDQEIIPIKAPK